MWTDDGSVFEGGFALRGRLLSMNIVGPRGEHQIYLTFLVDYSEAGKSQRIERSLQMTRVGSEPTVTSVGRAPVLHLNQIQQVTDQHPPNTE